VQLFMIAGDANYYDPNTGVANGIHDARIDTWGTGLRFRDGCGIRPVADGGRVVTPEHDPLVTVP